MFLILTIFRILKKKRKIYSNIHSKNKNIYIKNDRNLKNSMIQIILKINKKN